MLLALLLRGRCGTLTVWEVLVRAWSLLGSGSTCLASATLGALGATFAWEVQHFDCLGSVGARLVAARLRLQLRGTLALLLRGRCNSLTVCKVLVRAWSPLGSGSNCMAGAALGTHGATSAWQAQHLVLLALLLRGRCSTLTAWDVPARAWSQMKGIQFMSRLRHKTHLT